MKLAFFVAGTPAPKGSRNYYGKGRSAESSKAEAPWREDVRQAAMLTARDEHWFVDDREPIGLRVSFWVKRPTGHPKTRRTWPVTKPDLDKLLRSTCDALTSAGVIADDARITEIHASMHYVHPEHLRLTGEPDRPGAHIEIHRMEEA